MPLYEFRCTVCDHLFEKLQGRNDDTPECPVCNGETERLISVSTIRLKGSGFHTTDYSRHGPRK